MFSIPNLTFCLMRYICTCLYTCMCGCNYRVFKSSVLVNIVFICVALPFWFIQIVNDL